MTRASAAPMRLPSPVTSTLGVRLRSRARIRASITVAGTKARVVPVQRAGTMVYRVILGPYPSREAAEQAGAASKRTFWVYAEEQ